MKKGMILNVLLLVAGMAFAEQSPNIVLIFTDDLGYGDVGCYGATHVQTPNIDKLAAEGRRFTDAHSASAVCTPSRYALLTGEYPFRGNKGKGHFHPCGEKSPLLISTNKLTIASVLKQKGYDTSAIGKWHLGFGNGNIDWNGPLRPGPVDVGFDTYFGVPRVNSGGPFVYVENDRILGLAADDPIRFLGSKEDREKFTPTPVTQLLPGAGVRSGNRFSGAIAAHKLYNDYQVGTTFAKRASKWIGERTDKPFFLYLATTNVHHPFTPAKRFQGTSKAGIYGDYIHELDWMVGEVMKALEEKGVADNTLVVFTSDNGGMFNRGGQTAFDHGHRQNGDLLGFKFGAWEGGHRVPFIAKWPGRIEPGTVSDQLICNVDMLATFAAITGQSLDKKQQADSVNVLPALVSDPKEPVRKELVISPKERGHVSLRRGKWMFIPAQGSGGFNGKGGHTFGGAPAASFIGNKNSDIAAGKFKPDAAPAQLYDLEADVSQAKNLYNEYPEVVKEMQALLEAYRPAAWNAPKRKRDR